MNTKGATVFGVLIAAGIFLMFWIVLAAPLLGQWGHQMVVINGLTGVEAIVWENLNLIVGFFFVIFLIMGGYAASGGQ